eukprot:7338649-Karenia_brevis.AAC.1
MGGQWQHVAAVAACGASAPEMRSRGLSPNVISFNAAISTCVKGGRGSMWRHYSTRCAVGACRPM